MLLRIEHETRLSYSNPVSETVFEVRMIPPSTEDQTVLTHHVRTTPRAAAMTYRDGYSNRVCLFNLPQSYRELVVAASSLLRLHRRPVAEIAHELPWPLEDGPIAVEALEFLRPSPLVDASPALDTLVAGLPTSATTLGELLLCLIESIQSHLIYEKKITSVRTPLSEALALGRGVCQDFSHLFLGMCRRLGLPARYVSGYIHHPGELATHAWCQVWAGPRARWLDIDPTSGCFVADDHVLVAIGRDYSDVPPNRGVWKGQAEETISVSVKVESIDRVPVDSNDWSMAQPRFVAPVRSSRARVSVGLHGGLPVYPNQRAPRAGLHQQQAEQQQQ